MPLALFSRRDFHIAVSVDGAFSLDMIGSVFPNASSSCVLQSGQRGILRRSGARGGGVEVIVE